VTQFYRYILYCNCPYRISLRTHTDILFYSDFGKKMIFFGYNEEIHKLKLAEKNDRYKYCFGALSLPLILYLCYLLRVWKVNVVLKAIFNLWAPLFLQQMNGNFRKKWIFIIMIQFGFLTQKFPFFTIFRFLTKISIFSQNFDF